MRRGLVVLLGFEVIASPVYAVEPYRFGRLAERLPLDDLVAVAATVADQGQPWALLGWYSQVLPEVRYIDAFLTPAKALARLRRGRFVHLECSPTAGEAACLRWARTDASGDYAQVADGPEAFGAAYTVRRLRERPFRVHGTFSDEEVVSLVAYIRTGPRPPAEPGWTAMGISGAEPIQDIHREADGSVRVVMTSDGYVFEVATCVRSGKAWRITDAVHGVA